MLGFLFSNKFSTKCKHFIKKIKDRLALLKKERSPVLGIHKKDMVDLLRCGFEMDAYLKADVILDEIDRSYCYNAIEKFVDCIRSHLSKMQKLRDCPLECREAVASLIFAAIWFLDLPELRELRFLFVKRYHSVFRSSVNKTLEKYSTPKHYSTDMKIQLMTVTSREYLLNWDPSPLKRKLKIHSFASRRAHIEKNMDPPHEADRNGFPTTSTTGNLDPYPRRHHPISRHSTRETKTRCDCHSLKVGDVTERNSIETTRNLKPVPKGICLRSKARVGTEKIVPLDDNPYLSAKGHGQNSLIDPPYVSHKSTENLREINRGGSVINPSMFDCKDRLGERCGLRHSAVFPTRLRPSSPPLLEENLKGKTKESDLKERISVTTIGTITSSAPHVHPKLPDYQEIVKTFTALKQRK